MEVRSESGDLVVVDAGTGIRRVGEKLLKERATEFDLLFTHAHLDHLMGFPFFLPIYQKGTTVRIHGCPFDAKSYREILTGVMCNPYCPVNLTDVDAKLEYHNIAAEPFRIGSLSITPINLSHPNGGLGYRFEENGFSFVFLTDNELDYTHPRAESYDRYVEFSRNADLLIHDAEYTAKDYSRTWGHSQYSSAVRLAIKAGVKRFGLFHINQKRTDDEVDAMVAESGAMFRAAHAAVECFALSNMWEMRLA
jgi:ribonuclease BN (tRNA processing enzyme)